MPNAPGSVPNYTLIGSLTSPYVRRLRLVLALKKIAYDFELVDYMTASGDAKLTALTPLKRIPVLIVHGEALWESRVIFNFLQRTHQLFPELSVSEENLLSAVDTLQDQLIQAFLLKRFNHPVDRANGYFQRGLERQRLMLAHLNAAAPRLSTVWAYPSVCLYTLLDWALFRQILTEGELGDGLNAFYRAHQAREQVAATDPRLAS